jgi:hypothetical protein
LLDKQINLSPSDPFLLRIKVSASPAPQMLMSAQVIGEDL